MTYWKHRKNETQEEFNARRKQYLLSRPEEVKELEKQKKRTRNNTASSTIRNFVEGFKIPCKCGESDPCALDFHHKNSEDKLFTLSSAAYKGRSFKEIEEEIAKCDILCANCHRKLHFSRGTRVSSPRQAPNQFCPNVGHTQVSDPSVTEPTFY